MVVTTEITVNNDNNIWLDNTINNTWRPLSSVSKCVRLLKTFCDANCSTSHAQHPGGQGHTRHHCDILEIDFQGIVEPENQNIFPVPSSTAVLWQTGTQIGTLEWVWYTFTQIAKLNAWRNIILFCILSDGRKLCIRIKVKRKWQFTCISGSRAVYCRLSFCGSRSISSKNSCLLNVKWQWIQLQAFSRKCILHEV